jgi:hypothetical protein
MLFTFNASICDFLVRYVRVVNYNLLVIVACCSILVKIRRVSNFHQNYVQLF